MVVKDDLGQVLILYMRQLSPKVKIIYSKDWGWNWNSNTLATSCEELTHWKRLWCWGGLGAGGEGDNGGWDGWMASLTRCTWVWVNSGGWWWTGRPGVLLFMGSQRVGHDWATELNKVLMVITQHYEFFKSHRIGQQRVNFTIWKFKLKLFTASLMTFFTLILSTGENGKEKFLPFFQFEKQ